MDETTFESNLRDLLASLQYMDKDNHEEVCQALCLDDVLEVEDATTFENAGVMTSNKGVVVTLPDGSQFQVTVVKSRSAF